MREFRHLSCSIDEHGVLSVAFARPPANAVDRDMYIEIEALFSDPDKVAPGVKAIVLSGEGRHFCAGNDLEEFASMTLENGTERMWRVREAFFAIQDCIVPVIGAVHGAALGTGLAVAASCDFLLAEPDARFGLPELTVGVMGGARHLARLVPQAMVRRMFFTGEPMLARDLVAVGAPIILVESGELLNEARRYARRIASFSPTATRLAKQILNRIEFMDLKTGYEFEQRYSVAMSGHPDAKEAVASVREKRAPVYLDRHAGWSIDVEANRG